MTLRGEASICLMIGESKAIFNSNYRVRPENARGSASVGTAKHFTVAASEKGKQIYIDFDGAMSHSGGLAKRQIRRRLALWICLVPARSDAVY